MNQKILTISPGQTIVIEWAQNWSNLTIHKDGVLIGSVQEKTELKAGRRFALPGGGEIMVLMSDYGLEVWHDGKELVSGTQSGSVDGFGSAFKALISVGSLQLVVAALFLFLRNEVGLIICIFLGVIGAGLIALGLWARDSGSKTPFWIGIAFCVINILLTLASASLAGIAITGILLYYLYRGTQSPSPQPTRKKDLSEHAPLDSNL